MSNLILFITSEAVQTVFVYALVILFGLWLSKIKIKGISFGIAFALFVGIIFKSIGFNLNHSHIELFKEFGLILFVYALGYQLGPSFFNSFKKEGLKYNLLAFLGVFLSVCCVVVFYYIFNMDISILVGILQGAITNTPGLGAAQQALKEIGGQSLSQYTKNVGVGYAIVYPFGILGIISSMLIIKKLFDVDIEIEASKLNKNQKELVKANIIIRNSDLNNIKITDFKTKFNFDFIISRVKKESEIIIPNKDTELNQNDVILVICEKINLDEIIKNSGEITKEDISKHNGKVTTRKIIVTQDEVLNIPLYKLDLINKYGITITRIYRMGLELLPKSDMTLQFGDIIRIVGEEEEIEKIVKLFGHSQKKLYEPNLIPIFLGILLGIVIGYIPIPIPGLPAAFKLGAAGGTIIVSILMSKYSPKLNLKNYMTPGVNLMLRDLGILLFLASVGLNVGSDYFTILFSRTGLEYICLGLIITILPLLLIGIISYRQLKLNYLSVSGMMAGITTDPPALAYAQSFHQSEYAVLSYATVYPFVTFLRILFAQLLVLIFIK